MPEEVLTIVRIPIVEIEESLRTKHLLPKILKDVHIDGDSLVFYFGDDQGSLGETASVSPANGIRRRRRTHRKRNRMKTRGWDIVARITNSKGQKCAIYKPFVDALRDSKLSSEEQRAVIERILKSNRNRPTEVSVQYFLENTLEYLRNQERSKEKTV
jgi:hypothetical protein